MLETQTVVFELAQARVNWAGFAHLWRLFLHSFIVSEQKNQISVLYRNSDHSEQYGARTMDPISVHNIINRSWPYAGTVKRHNICNRHVAIDTEVKQTERTSFSIRYFNGIKIVTAFKCNFEETMPKLSFNLGNHISQEPISRSRL